MKELLETFIEIAPSPRPSPTETRTVEPTEPKMTGFVFKIHANMDPNHRDRIAFLKICSGTFERNRNYFHVRSGKQMKFSSPNAFMAEKKSIVDFAYPGDIVGLHDTGNFKIGDTFTEGENLKFTGIPSFRRSCSVTLRMPTRRSSSSLPRVSTSLWTKGWRSSSRAG